MLRDQAMIGISLLPQERGKGFGLDALKLVLEFGFVVRGLHRLALWTLHDNIAMQRVSSKAGMAHEGTLKQSMWWNGAHRDVFLYGMLSTDWRSYDVQSS